MTDTTPSTDPITSLLEPTPPGETNRDLPVGVHPLDRAEPTHGQLAFGTASPASADTMTAYTPGRKPFATDNPNALGVFQRASADWSARVIVVDASMSGGTAQATGRQRGRVSVTLSVPATLADGSTPLGVLFAPTEDAVQAGGNACGLLNVGDSVTLYTEASVWLGVIGANATGACMVLAEFNATDSPGY